MGVIRYPKYTQRDLSRSLFDIKSDRCFKLSISLSRVKKNKVLIIGRNPKRLEDDSCNNVTKRIVKFLRAKEEYGNYISTVEMVNLFVVYDFEEVQYNKGYRNFICGNEDNFEIEGKRIKNDDVIKQAIEESSEIILAWGEPIKGIESLYNERIEKVLKILRECLIDSNEEKNIYTIGDLSVKGYPKHPLAWSFRDAVKVY
ncbi:DUF1643 domain-containing protein [Clostridium intestinale]|jgi:hypothetical protein|uniref:DUF1643 domain-containing protein n=1 Tax=Clostridium intestinale URNW TaxID=1294142 RepID=U2NHR4_9CLOT|nr:DUF1643 domain-containing protein [Clostridium intestinale]ERK28411.1 hypothetical protein CINTURNW_4492 [Clostridium intestinale URNW]